ncbi:ROK family transcriptional regulator [Labrys wisconsinensis]|uniref:NBD/HSP70 family sugar kinase/biotin operon repressor n=1 Tax=Labrys wisconsinensis TaxID=425677 RepID=A0ABU0J5W0_9HYPH|nr:ROK family transcriptional regulator [Labrys wisconsinensis]MDQ0469641.1 putative NBD/HSP70 family sugar kinase/biotin operon repressor [Labrys wisconsinensis]
MAAQTTSSTPIARKISTNAAVRTVLAKGPISRADIAKLTGLSKQTVSEVVQDLIDEGWLRSSGRTDGKRGRSAITYELNARAGLAASIDLGGAKIAVAIGDLLGTIIAETVVPTDPRGGRHLVDQFEASLHALAAEADVGIGDLRLAVLGTPGVFDPATGQIRAAPNVPGLESIDMRRLLGGRLGIPVLIENDVNLAALGEQWRGHGADKKNFAFIALGTGIGMGIVANGALVRGARGAAGEICFLPLGGDPFDPRSFTLGTLESAVGSAAIARRYAGFGGPEDSTVKDLFSAFAAGGPSATATIEETARLIAVAIAAIGVILDPEIVILGGNIGSRPELVDAIRRLLPRCTPYPIRLEISQFGGRAALIGGLGVAVRHMHDDLFGIGLKDV